MTNILGSMATFPPRENSLKQSVASILPQVDRLHLCLNQYSDIPPWISAISKIDAYIPDRDLKDIGKFALSAAPEDDIFLLDDDLPYPADYVSRTLARRNSLPPSLQESAVFGYHGTVYNLPSLKAFFGNYLKRNLSIGEQLSREKSVYPYFDALDRALFVSQLGTGTVLLRGRDVPPLEYLEGSQKRVDVRFARWCLKKGLSQVMLARDSDWLARGGDDDVSIYTTYTKNTPAEFTREVLRFAFRVPHRGMPCPVPAPR